MGTKNPKEQCFMHIATYRLDALRTLEAADADLGPDVFEATITDTLANVLTERLTDVCVQHDWRLVDVHVHPDRVEALVTGVEPSGETGEAVATALDDAVYGEVSRRAATGAAAGVAVH